MLLVDTPGFDDTSLTESEILTDISRLLTFQSQMGIGLKGVIYLHRITDNRYQGSSLKALNIFKKICGELAFKNVLLVTTRWNEIKEADGAAREKQLREDFWAYMLGNGSTMTRFNSTRESAMVIVSKLVSKQTIVLELQRELVNEGRTLQETTAGGFISENVAELKAQCEGALRDLEEIRKKSQENDRTIADQIRGDLKKEKDRLEKLKEDKERLGNDIALEVRQKVEQETKNKKGGLHKMLRWLPKVLSMLGMFVTMSASKVMKEWGSEAELGGSFANSSSDLS